MCGGGRGQSLAVVVDDVDAAKERLHREPTAVPRGATGREHVVGPGEVVAEGDRRVGADEDGSGVANASSALARVGGDDLEVLGSPLVDDLQPLVEVVDEHEGALLGQRGLDPLAVPGGRQLRCDLASTASSSSAASVTSRHEAFSSCSAWAIRSAAR